MFSEEEANQSNQTASLFSREWALVMESSDSDPSDYDPAFVPPSPEYEPAEHRQSMIKSNRKLKSPLKMRNSPEASGEFEGYANSLRREIESGEECERINIIESLPLSMAREMLGLAVVALRREREAREEAEFMFEQFIAITNEAQRQISCLGSKKRKTPYDRPE